MANVKITDLGAYTNPVSTDVLPIVDVGADVTKKVSIADLLENAGSGTAAAPGIAFDGDNTGIYRPGAGQLAISTNGTGRLFIDSSGRLGLGTNSPSTTNGGLDIASGGIGLIIGADGSLSSRTNATNKQAKIGAYHYTNSEEPVGIATVFSTASSNAVYFGGGTASLNAATALEFYTAANTTTTTGTQRMVIDSSGRLGLGTSSPTSSTQIEVVKNSSTAWAANTIDDVYRAYNSNTTTNGASSIIGAYCNYGDGSFGGVRFGAVSSASFSADFVVAPRNVGTFTEALRVTSTGLVGIGTTNPGVNLHVTKTASTSTPSTSALLALENATTANLLDFVGNDGTASAQGLSFSDGTVSRGRIWYTHSEDSLAFSTLSQERARITSDGKLGLGTSSPSAKLHVRAADSDTVATLLRLEQFNAAQTDSARLVITADVANNLVTYDATGFNTGSHVFLTGGLDRARIDSSGRLLVGTSSQSGGSLLQVNDDRIRIASSKTPASASDTGTAGEICWDSSYIYVCTATDTWKRAALSTW